MIPELRLRPLRALAISWLLIFTAPSLSAQLTFSGANAPGSVRDIQLTVGAATTNFSMTISGSSTAFSHLLLKAGGPPGPATFDYAAIAEGQGNAIHLERPDVLTTNYVLRVETPTNSQTHIYTVTVTGNEGDLRTAAKPTTKGIVSFSQGSLSPNSWHYYRVDIPTNISGWKLTLNSTNGVYPDLYVRRDQVPTTAAFLKRSQSLTNDLIIFSGNEINPGVYLIGVYQPASASGASSYTLQSDLLNFTTLNWDPGTTHPGTEIYSSPNTNGGDYYFKITALNSTVGGWRTALNVSTGEANVYLSRGTPPTTVAYQYKSDRIGSDGFILPSTAFNAGEDWYVLVHANPGANWTLMSGEPYVANLGVLAADSSSGSGSVTIGPEGIRLFKTTTPGNIAAWRLWLNGQTNNILVRKLAIPFLTLNDLNQAAQMLVVPGYLGGSQLYFVGIPGLPGAAINLDSRQQPILDIGFQSTNQVTVTNGYSTYRVTVPTNQIAWQVNVVVSNGNPNLAVRRNLVPNENNNDAYSEVGGLVTDSITLVPPSLSDGTFYVTVYGTNSHTFALQSGIPVVTDINFVGTTINTDTNRVGWRFFRVADINQQIGSLGWDLFLTNYVRGTRIALRRNAVPGIWNFRNPNQGSSGSYDYLSAAEFLQRPGHQADVWYVGVYNPTNALRDFALVTGELAPETVTLDGGISSRSGVPAGKWQFFRVDVSTNLIGWDVRLTNVTSGSPQVYVRKELLPTLPSLDPAALAGKLFSMPVVVTNWPSGNQWSPVKDWTERDLSPGGTVNETGRILTFGMGRPLDPGTYYVGVINVAADTNTMSYTLSSRGIGNGRSIPVTDIPFIGSATVTNLAPRDIACFRVAVPSNTPSWKVKLTPMSGDALLAVAKDRLPNISAAIGGSVTNTATAGRKMLSIGNEHFVQLPGGFETNVFGGNYYLLVASDGQVEVTNRTRIGTGASSFVLESLGAMPETDLGQLAASDLLYDGQLEGGETAVFSFENTPDTIGFEISLENRVGNPTIVSSDLEGYLGDPGSGNGAPQDLYGNEGGVASISSTSIITVANPYAIETILVKARASSGDYPDATYRLRVRKLVPQPLAFDGGAISATDQTELWRYYEVHVPPGALGWDIRISDVQSGSPQMVVCRDYYPVFTTTSGGFSPGNDTRWLSGNRWAASQDWTQRGSSSNGLTNETGRILGMGMGRPLEPGTYYVGIRNNSSPSTTAAYTLQSRGIGTGMSIPVVDLPFAGGSVSGSALAPREAAYYRTVIPAGSSSWRTKLTTVSGESMLLALSNSVPSVLTGRGGSAGRAMQKSGNEHYLLVPTAAQPSLGPQTNYLAVVSEGVLGSNSVGRIGTGTSSYTIESKGELSVTNLGVAGSTDLVRTDSLEGGETKAYQFDVPTGMSSLEVRLENITGTPVMVLRVGTEFPYPGAASTVAGTGSVSVDDYGNEGGFIFTALNGNANSSLVTVANPTNGIYTVMVKARPVSGVFTNATYTLRVRALDVTIVNFDGGFSVVTNQAAGSWRYFLVDVPDTALGWDVRVTDVTAGLPRVVVRRDLLPDSFNSTPTWGLPGNATNWPSTNQWAANYDWTRRYFSPNGTVDESGRILAAGIGRPLEPGTYYIGVKNSTTSSNMNYTLLSRGIGDSLALPVTDLQFDGGSESITNISPHEATYFRVTVPFNTPGWKVKLSATSGESMLVVLKDSVPNVDSGQPNSDTGQPSNAGKSMQKAGNDHYVLLPPNGQSNLAAGTYYLAVVGEGVNPSSNTRIGTNTSNFSITSEGSIPIPYLGIVSATDLVQADTLEGGESKFYQFTGPSGFSSFEVRLEDRVGNPVMVLANSGLLPDLSIAAAGIPLDTYGNQGGYITNNPNGSIFVIPNATNGLYTIGVKARRNPSSGGPYSDSSYTLRVRQIPVPELNFSSELNTNGLLNSTAGQLLNNESVFFKVIVPTNINGMPVLGWELDLTQSSGLASVRVRKDALPSDGVPGMAFATNSAVIAPGFLTNGTWYVEVRGINTTTFTLTSKAVALQRPPWQMPGDGDPVTTPGLVAPIFGDTDVDTNGVASTGLEGTALQQGYYHFYAVTVPTNNAGLMRVQLKAISGYPDMFLRTNMIPTASHTANGTGTGTPLADRTATGSTTDYANWVPVDGKTEARLKPGRWYVAVRASQTSNARYRLMLSTGNIQDLPIDGGSLANQSVVNNDWRYYRVRIPQDSPQVNWSVTFSQLSGDVKLYIRDTVPPGNGATTAAQDYKDWLTDGKHIASYTSYDAPGTYTFTVPPLRPGVTYYLGFRGNSDANFAVSSSVSGGALPQIPTINFYGGTATNVIAPFNQVLYRIFVPADASRWKHSSINSNVVQMTLANGTLPTATTYAWRVSAPNTTLSQALGPPTATWPWVTNVNFYLQASNTTAVPQPFYFAMDGKSVITDDSDNDGLPDRWEYQYFGTSLASQNGSGDYDADGVSNQNEYNEGTNPTDKSSLRPRLTVLATNGVVNVNPVSTNYAYGAVVTLTPVPNNGFGFASWAGGASGFSNPLQLVLSSNTTVVAIFKVPGDDFSQRIPMGGYTTTATGSTAGATREPGEPNHAGTVGGSSIWWTWTAPFPGPVSITAQGTGFNPALGVYTGDVVNGLSVITGDIGGGGTNTSLATFIADEGVEYQIAVDTASGGTGTVNLSLTMAGLFAFIDAVPLPSGAFQLTVIGPNGQPVRIDATTDFVTWITLTNLINSTGTLQWVDTGATNFDQRYYRAVGP